MREEPEVMRADARSGEAAEEMLRQETRSKQR